MNLVSNWHIHPPSSHSFLFWFDFIFMVPFAGIIISCDPGMSELNQLYVGLLGFLKLVIT